MGLGNTTHSYERACRQLAFLATTSAMSLVLSQPGYAQDVASAVTEEPEQASGGLLGEIVVTAQKRSESSQKVPVAINAFSSEQLKSVGTVNATTVAQLVPGFTVAPSFRGPQIYTLRGVGFNTPNLSASSPVGVYVDEIAYPYPVMTDGLALDLERVEVLKGPQGTLYGRNTTGGLINFIAKKPSQDSEGYVRMSVGNYKSYGVEGALAGGITPTLSARLAFKLDKSDEGWQVSVTRGDKRGKVDKMSSRLTLLWEPTSNLEATLTGNWWRDNSETIVGQAIAVYPKAFGGNTNAPGWVAAMNALGFTREQIVSQAFNPTRASQANWVVNDLRWGGTVGGRNFNKPPLDTRKDNDLWSLASRVNWRISDAIALTSLTSYARYRQDQPVDVAGWEIENTLSRGNGDIESFQQELRLAGNYDRFDFIFGGFYGNDRISVNDRNWGATVSPLAASLRPLGAMFAGLAGGTLAQQEDALWGFRDWQNKDDQTVKTWSVFAQGNYDVTDKLKLTLGLRYTQDKVRSVGCSLDQGDNSIAATWNAFFNGIGINSNVAPGGCVTYLDDIEPAFLSRQDADPTNDLPYPGQGLVRKSLSQNNLAGRIALSYQANNDLMIYGSATRGFKSGTIPNIDSNVGTQRNPVSQEEIRAYEVGFKSKPLPGVVFNASGFYYDYRDKQVFGAVPDLIYTYLTRLVNIPKSNIYGGEVELSGEVARDLSLRLAGTYLHSKIDEYTGYDALGNVRNFDGTNFTFTPSWQLSSTASYRFDLNSDWQGRFSVTGRYSGKQKADLFDDPRFRIKDYTVFDANLIILDQKGKYEFELFARNMFNKYYWTSVQTDQDNITRFAGMPRTFGAAVRVNF